MLLHKGETLLIIERTAAKREREPFGRMDGGWAEAVDNLLKTIYPELVVRVEVSASDETSGFQASKSVWQQAIQELKPDWLVLPILAEDLLPFESTALQEGLANRGRDPEQSSIAAIRQFIAEARASVKQLVLLTSIAPGQTSSECDTGHGSKMHNADVVRAAADEYGCLVIDAEAVNDEVSSKYVPFEAEPGDADEEHSRYNIVLAGAFLRLVGFQWLRRRSFASSLSGGE